jgi:transposase InsO family protein
VDRAALLEFVGLARKQHVRLSTICKYLEITPRTIQNWKRLGNQDRRKGSLRYIPHKLTPEEEQAFYQLATSLRFADNTPEEIVAILLNEGTYKASSRTLYRILKKRNALQHRQESKKPVASKGPQRIPITGPDQLWAWDITWLKTSVRGIFFYAYTIIDVWDRRVVGWAIEENESEVHSIALFRRILRGLSVLPRFIHADNGSPMRGSSLAVFLDGLGVTRSHSRPRVSDDNAFIESWHKTLKYTVGYPAFFSSLEEARIWFAGFVVGYNTSHLHSGLDYVTPLQAHTGEALAIYQHRNQTLLEARTKHPRRWIRPRIKTYAQPPVVSFCRPFPKSE